MFHVLLGQTNRRAGLVETVHRYFPRLLGMALVARLAVHAVSAVTNAFDPVADFAGRFVLMLAITSLLFPLWAAYRYAPRFRPWAFHAFHAWAIVQYPIEAALFGSGDRDVWLLFLLCHAISAVVIAYTERKAVLMGFVATAFLAVGLMLDRTSQVGQLRHVFVVVAGVPLLSVVEYLVARFAQMLWHKDQRIVELATQNENGLRMLSHDLANILSLGRDSIEMALEDLEDGKDKVKPETVTYLDETRFAIVQGVGMLQAVRDYLAIFSGKKDPFIEEFCLADVLRDVVQLWQRSAKKKQISLALSCRVDKDKSIVRGSRPLFTHTIVGNLVSNAIKFSPPKSRILVSLHLDGMNDELVIEVTDQGEGISSTRLHSIFDAGGQTSSVGTRGELGTGFGLPLVRATLAIFGGRIWADSGASRLTLPNGELAGLGGSTFTCRIPRRGDASREGGVRPPPPPGSKRPSAEPATRPPGAAA
jgi:signal transduction histidine kinase